MESMNVRIYPYDINGRYCLMAYKTYGRNSKVLLVARVTKDLWLRVMSTSQNWWKVCVFPHFIPYWHADDVILLVEI